MSEPQAGVSYRVIVGWLVPLLLTGVLSILGWIGLNIQDIRVALGVFGSRVEDHERRLDNLETLFLHNAK